MEREIFKNLTAEETKFISNFGIYLSLLRANKWVIKDEVLGDALKQWKDHYGSEAPLEIFGALAIIAAPYVIDGERSPFYK